MITLITPTGFRPEAFALCVKYMKRQTYKEEIQWLISLDDNANFEKPEMPENWNVELIVNYKKWRPGFNTQRLSLDHSLAFIKGDLIINIEDDDWYSPTYLDTYVALLGLADAVGIGNSKYYNLKTSSYKEMQNYAHSSLCQTAFRKELLPVFEQAINSGEKYIDIEFWRLATNKLILSEFDQCIGIKGLPGRPGIGVGHRPDDTFIPDYEMEQLTKWIGRKDAEAYKPFYVSATPLNTRQRGTVQAVTQQLKPEIQKLTKAVQRAAAPVNRIPGKKSNGMHTPGVRAPEVRPGVNVPPQGAAVPKSVIPDWAKPTSTVQAPPQLGGFQAPPQRK